MKKKRWALLAVCSAALLFLLYKAPNFSAAERARKLVTGQGAKNDSPETKLLEKIPLDAKSDPAPTPPAEQQAESGLVLRKENFEEQVAKCFQGEPCELGEDPWNLYQYYKRSQHPRTCDSIIAFLRRKMAEAEYREKYKDVLLRMIRDFYPPREIDFQVAAYYAYLGELDKSLELYLALEKRSAKNPELRKAPKLNIANVYYDLRRYREALPYYQSALREYQSGPEVSADQRALTEFVQKRIAEIEAGLN